MNDDHVTINGHRFPDMGRTHTCMNGECEAWAGPYRGGGLDMHCCYVPEHPPPPVVVQGEDAEGFAALCEEAAQVRDTVDAHTAAGLRELAGILRGGRER